MRLFLTFMIVAIAAVSGIAEARYVVSADSRVISADQIEKWAMTPVFRTTCFQKSVSNRSIRYYASEISADLVSALESAPGVLSVREAKPLRLYETIPDDPRFDEQWHLKNTGQIGTCVGCDIGATFAWDFGSGSLDVVVATVDSGLFEHSELEGLVSPDGYNVHDDNADLTDGLGHGTKVSGVIAAGGNNAMGICGVCWGVTILPVKVLDNRGNGDELDLVRGIEYAATHGAHIINMCLGVNGASEPIKQACDAAREECGCILIAAAGNDGNEAINTPGALEGVLGVAATDPDDVVLTGSNYGTWVDLSAPGEEIITLTNDGDYIAFRGTSAAAPVVSGAAALLKSLAPEKTVDEIYALLLDSAEPIDHLNPARQGKIGAGRLNLAGAVSLLMAETPVPTATVLFTATPAATSTYTPSPSTTSTPSPTITPTTSPPPTPTTAPTPTIAPTPNPAIHITVARPALRPGDRLSVFLDLSNDGAAFSALIYLVAEIDGVFFSLHDAPVFPTISAGVIPIRAFLVSGIEVANLEILSVVIPQDAAPVSGIWHSAVLCAASDEILAYDNAGFSISVP